MVALLLFLAIGFGSSRVLSDRVDLIELNRIYDSDDKLRLEQVILWEWSPAFRRYDVVAWRMMNEQPPYRLPGGDWCFRWHERDARITREVRSTNYRETHTRHDPEIANQSFCRDRSILRKR